MTPSDVRTLIGMVTQFQADMTERFNGVDAQLKVVDSRVSKIELSREREQGAADATKAANERAEDVDKQHILSLRWRATIAVAAGGSAATLLLGVVRFATGH
jgi:hypothetical protein